MTDENQTNSCEFWSSIGEKLIWSKKWEKICDHSDAPITKWYSGGELNMCYNAVDRHIIDGHGERQVIFFDSPVTNTKRRFTYNDIFREVRCLGTVLRSFNVEKGDIVMIYMPMIVEGVFSMLASCRLGAVHCAMPSGLPAQDLRARIDHCKPKVVLMASHGYHANGWVNYKDILDEAISKAKHKPQKVLVLKRRSPVNMENGRDEDWVTSMEKASCEVDCLAVPVKATDPLLAIYTSGSTGNPKAIVHSVGSYAARMVCDSPLIFDEDEILYFASNYGWIAGQILVYLPLLTRLKSVIYEGDCLFNTDVDALYKLIQDNEVTRPLLRPGILKILKTMDPKGLVASQYNLKRVRRVNVTGESSDKSTLQWVSSIFHADIINGYGQTETSTFVSGRRRKTPEIAYKYRNTLPGWDVVVRKSDNEVAKINEVGRVLIRLPLPPGGMSHLLGESEKGKKEYFTKYPGYFDTKDNGFFDESGNLVIQCRADDIMKHASIYLSAQAVEEVVMCHPNVAQCVVVPVTDLILKEKPVIMYVPIRDSKVAHQQLSEDVVLRTSLHFGESVIFGKAVPVREFPLTRTGKIHRPSLRSLVEGRTIQGISAIENAGVLEDIASQLRLHGYASDPDTPLNI